MQKKIKTATNVTILEPLSVIRTDTIFCRLPIHMLSKRGNIEINITRLNADGEVELQWITYPNHMIGVPRQLALNVDKLVINRRIELFGNHIPRIIRIGSLKDIAKILKCGGDTNIVKHALEQNAATMIRAKFPYKDVVGNKRYFELFGSRYSIIYSGMNLPNNRDSVAEAVYVVFDEMYLSVLNSTKTRPLDFDYFSSLPPSSSRWYEILSFQVFSHLKYRKNTAQITYSEYCALAPLTRHFTYDKVKKQMYKVHLPHIKSDYIRSIRFQSTVDSEGNPDWMMFYEPGEKARIEFESFQQPKQMTYAESIVEAQPDKEAVSESVSLVTLFNSMFLSDTVVGESKKSEAQAQNLLNKYGYDKAKFIVEYAHQVAPDTNFKPKFFGGILQYADAAVSVYDQSQLSKASKKEAATCGICYGKQVIICHRKGTNESVALQCTHDESNIKKYLINSDLEYSELTLV